MLIDDKVHQLKGEQVVADHMRWRSFNFWQRKHVLLGWPVEPKGHTFLGHAVHNLGQRLFPDWDSKTPQFAGLPILDGSRPYISNGFDAVFAADILANLGGTDAVPHPETRDWAKGLSPRDFDTAINLYLDHVAAGHREAMARTASVVKALIDGAAQDLLKISARSNEGILIPIPHRLWSTEQAYSRFAECQIDPANPTIAWQVNIVDVCLGDDPGPALISGNLWLFVDTPSLDQLIENARPATTPPALEVDRRPKKSVPDKAAAAWWKEYTESFIEPEHPTFKDAKRAWLDAFPKSSVTQFQRNLWERGRPSWWPRRVHD